MHCKGRGEEEGGRFTSVHEGLRGLCLQKMIPSINKWTVFECCFVLFWFCACHYVFFLFGFTQACPDHKF